MVFLNLVFVDFSFVNSFLVFTLYVTLEPCALCMNAILMTRLKRVCFSAKSPRWGFTVDQLVIFEIYKTSLILSEGLFRIEAEKLLVNFFKLHRN